MFILKTGHQPGVYVPLRTLFLVLSKVKVEMSGKRPTKLPANRGGTDSGTFVTSMAVNPKLNQLKV